MVRIANIKKAHAIIAILALAMSLSGCINYEQETFLNEDRSGHIDIHISLSPKEFISNLLLTAGEKVDAKEESKIKIKPILEESLPKAASSVKCEIKEGDVLKGFNQGTVKNISFRKEDGDGTTHFYFGADFDDITTLYTDKKRISISEDKDGRVTYTERFSSSDADTARSKDTDIYSPELFKGYHFKYTLHMPRNIVSANTDKVDKNMATWDIPIYDAMKEKDFTATVTIDPQNKFFRWRDKVMKKKVL